ncbi:Prefoldin subunit domain containing protein [Amanita muscaria]
MSQGKVQTISVADLDLSQLADVKKQLEEELNHLTNSLVQLKQAQAKFKTCIKNVEEIKSQNKDKTALVPLTNSLYVPGKLCVTEHVIVDIGTGYYVKKTRQQAIKHYTGKVEYIQTNLDTLEDTIQKKKDNLNYIVNMIQSKIQSQASSSS